MNILITGGLGYIGGRIADYLKEKEPTNKIFLTTRSKDRDLPSWTDKFTVLEMDILQDISINECLKNRMDIIIHLAAVNEIDSMKDPMLALEVNTRGTYRLLQQAQKNNVKRFIYFSTYHVYGETTDAIITEETPTRPFHPYALTHRAAEDFVDFFRHYHKMDILIFRLSNGYGYPMDSLVNRWTLVFNDLCRQAVTNGRLVLRSSGRQYRDFISLHDVSRAIHHFIFNISHQWGDGLYNLGGDFSISILDVAKKIAEVFSKKYNKEVLRIVAGTGDNPARDIRPVNYCIDKLKGTGFILTGDMETEIVRTMEICKEFCR
jgi:UDP-glucose 4-epimerase